MKPAPKTNALRIVESLGIDVEVVTHPVGEEHFDAVTVAGMLGVTVFGIFLTPVFFYVIDWLTTGNTTENAADNSRELTAPGG